MPNLVPIDQPQVRLMDQGGRLQRLPWFFLSHPLGGQLPKFLVYQRQKLLCGVGVALLKGVQDLRDFTDQQIFSACPLACGRF